MPPAAIGSYSIERELGRGGMGVVYLARDTRLERNAAIKALPADLASDPDRLARFQREARVLASLSHPNIATVYGLEHQDSQNFLVMEFIDGQTLAARLTRSPLPVDTALDLAAQIASALEAAHEKGVIHRDLKPGNIMLTRAGKAKVLDFGLAKSAPAPASPAAPVDSPESPTMSLHSPTIPGVILGTAGYLSPEQARGQTIDPRSDIFAYGCVLYEMLTGRRAFPGPNPSDAIGALLRAEPEWSALPAELPAPVRDLLTLCLAKDRRQRLRDIGDARLAIELARREVPRTRTPARRPRRELVAWGVALLAVAAAVLSRAARPNSAAPPRHPVRFNVPAPPGTAIVPDGVQVAISPNGRRVAFIAAEPGQPRRLWVHDLATSTSHVIERTDGAEMPFWSPDNAAVGFFAHEGLWRVSAEGGQAQRLADAPGGRGGSWGEQGLIVFAPLANGPLYVVPQSGGQATPALGLRAASHESGQRFPQFLPGGRDFIYASIASATRGSGGTCVASLDAKEGKDLVLADCRATYAGGGWLLFERSGVLYAQRLNLKTLTLAGEPLSTEMPVTTTSIYGGNFDVSASASGALVSTADGPLKSQVAEFGEGGSLRRTLELPPAHILTMSASDSGRHLVAYTGTMTSEFWLVDLARVGVWNRLLGDSNADAPRWSHDGAWVYFTANRSSRDLFRCAAQPGAAPELLLETGYPWVAARDASFDGRFLIYSRLEARNGRDLWLLDLQTKATRPIAASPDSEFDARFSPDGRLLAVAIAESDRSELYVQEFPDGKGRVRASLSGIALFNAPQDAAIRWSSDGSAIFYLDADQRTIRSVKVTRQNNSFQVGVPEVVLQLPPDVTAVEVGPDAKSIYGAVRAPGQAPCSIAVTLNWESLLPAGTPR